MNLPAIEISEIQDHVVQIKMQDFEHKNTFTEALLYGLIEAFDKVGKNPRYKAVILTGFDNYFATGGTQEGLKILQEGKVKFNELSIYSLAINCEVPVIAAMQGHAIGGGFVLGLFCDFVIFSRESFYNTNFMKYGFTPGMGATFIVPRKLGHALAEEMLLNAGNFRGIELEKRGIPFPVYPRDEVMDQAYKLAAELAAKPRHSLVILKDHLLRDVKQQLGSVIEKEVEMHDLTIHQPEVRQRIDALFNN